MSEVTFFLAPTDGSVQPSSGRGKRLTAAEEAMLISLCVENKHGEPFSDKTKRFWMQMSDLFFHAAGRNYSWQSCRRCMATWEVNNVSPECLTEPITTSTEHEISSPRQIVSSRELKPTTSTGPVPEALPVPSGIAAPQFDQSAGSVRQIYGEDSGSNTPDLADETDDDGLPTNLRVIRGKSKSITEKAALQNELCLSASKVIESFEHQIAYLNAALEDDLEHRRCIDNTFLLLKTQLEDSIQRFKKRAEEK
ncbi:hypothetical protein N7520_008200 [Penicillium odoratum]|uniref:uncharacterized protein n=1 Tax=Penicillium odoratum TaxID=1167516 RepID=UPI0025493C06|nr:uncharacterized protein N7520_008200 [Penicillium odoratum]KAJ5761044.1 hypothetical protein N7520_008200 [Penicillium odoratum]